MCVQTIDRYPTALMKEAAVNKSSNMIPQTIARKVLSQRQRHPQTKNSGRKISVLQSNTAQKGPKKKPITSASLATTAVIAGTTSAVSGVGVTILQHAIGFSVYLAYAPTTMLSQYATAQIAASMAGAIVSSTLISTIVNVAFGVIITLSTILVSVIVYNLFLANSYEDELSVFKVIGQTVTTVFRKIFG